ncbi:hypothetical protein RN001_003663 [Aquatica leii]|uniref:Myb/SANT-like DNA-binding domain-containing protein n=1 Tax=Aquatica leii TaxID=1421715 RepID=A0AAN7Q9S7_9COLE|nr:hypothetical protein RN001_003663 [Aquatica leii]
MGNETCRFEEVQRNSHVYSDMAQYINCEYKEILNSRTITAAEIKIKINNLTQRYRAEKKAIGPSGGAPSSWKYFESINKIVGSLPFLNRRIYVSSTGS